MYDFISIGDATIDTFVIFHNASVHCELKSQACQLCINYADKIPVDKMYRTVAGNAANAAVASSRLGLKTAFYTVLGKDTTGHEIFNTLKKEKIKTDYVVWDTKLGTNASTVLSYQHERSILVFHEKRNYKMPVFKPTKWIYITSLGHGFHNIHRDLVRRYNANNIILGFNPGTYQMLWGIKKLAPTLKITHVLSVNKEEAELLVNNKEKTEIKDLMLKLFKYGPKIVLITDGPKGAYAGTFVGSDLKMWFCPIFPGKVVDRTGCGDSFTTAFMSALFYKKSIQEALQWGSVNSASVVGQIGPQAGLLTKNELVSRLVKHPRYKVKDL